MPATTVLATALSLTALVTPQDPEVEPSYGHSAHGAAFDEGPRQRPWKIEGIGHAPFPVTSSHPEVQQWFDQGNTLLHSFWYYEAERAFRWCTVLDPDCAMAYWGMSRAVPYDRDRADEFLDQASERKHLVSDRERRYIEAWENAYVPTLLRTDIGRPGWNGSSKELAEELEKIILDYPDDVEAKALYVLNSLFESGRYANEAVLREIFEVAPDHPGAVHYRIHNWDTMELGHVALRDSARYGKIAWRVGHANHMPGHIYTKLGMWHEGAIWLDSATRVEKQYMQERLVLPHNAWNYAHNRNFLAHAQSMLGLPSAALQGAHDLLNAPLDPEYNKDEAGFSVFRQGLEALRRTLVRFEMWDEILAPGHIPWRDSAGDKLWKSYCQALAYTGTGDLARAEEILMELRDMAEEFGGGAVPGRPSPKEMAKVDPEERQKYFARRRLRGIANMMHMEAEGRFWLAKGDSVRGLRMLGEAAELEYEHRKKDNDPPIYPRSLYNVLGEAYLRLGSPGPSVAAFERSLESLPNSGFAWAGLTRAHHATGDLDAARQAYGRMLHIWSDAEPIVWQAREAHALGLQAEPEDTAAEPERSYAGETLARLGPNTWQPYAAPQLDALDADRGRVTLADYAGKNVLLIFYLSDQCVHCVEQLHAVEGKVAEFEKRNTVVLAISSDSPEKNSSNDVGSLPFAVLSDSEDHANAIRFKSYDEFEEMELHSTNLIDASGRLRWVRTGGDPFMDMQFLLDEIDRIAEIDERGRLQEVMPIPAKGATK